MDIGRLLAISTMCFFEQLLKQLYEMCLCDKMSSIMKSVQDRSHEIHMIPDTMIIRDDHIIGRSPDMDMRNMMLESRECMGSELKCPKRLTISESMIIESG
jgi:hypothetical protein